MLMLRRAPVASALLKPPSSVWGPIGITHRHLSTSTPRFLAATPRRGLTASDWNSAEQVARKSSALPDLELDPSFDALLGDMQMRSKDRAHSPREVADDDLELVSSGFGVRRQVPPEGEEAEWADRREERRSPAALLGTKKIGMVVLPDALVRGVQDAIEGGLV